MRFLHSDPTSHAYSMKKSTPVYFSES